MKNIDTKTILRRIYGAYGSSSGILFGINEEAVVASIIDFTLRQINRRMEEEDQDEYWNDVINSMGLYSNPRDALPTIKTTYKLLASETLNMFNSDLNVQVSDTTEA